MSILNRLTTDLVRPQYVLDGCRTTTLEAFYAEIGRVLLAGQPWGENLDALQSVLSGDYGQVPDRFRLIWCNTIVAKSALSYPHTVEQELCLFVVYGRGKKRRILLDNKKKDQTGIHHE